MAKKKRHSGNKEQSLHKRELSDDSFAELMGESYKPTASFQVGDEVEGTVIGFDSDFVFLDIGARLDGVLKRNQLSARKNEALKEGQTLTVFIIGRTKGSWQCGLRLGGSNMEEDDPQKVAALATLEDAYNRNLPIEGKVTDINKGGFEVQIMGQKAFCPISQIDKQYCETPNEYLKQTLTFIIIRFEEDGKNIVVSRREHLANEARKHAEQLWGELAEDAVYDGTVTAVKDFGVFVDIGGVDGLLHISEISYERNFDVATNYKVGQIIKVAIKTIDKVQRKVGLTLKPLLEDPWTAAVKKLDVGKEFQGKVVRMKTFGAFIELFPGVDGLVHISKLGSDRRHQHPKEVLNIGQIVNVRILEVDSSTKKISLTMEKEEVDYSDDLKNLKDQQDKASDASPSHMSTLFDNALTPEEDK